jgi:hypothetical protein
MGGQEYLLGKHGLDVDGVVRELKTSLTSAAKAV